MKVTKEWITNYIRNQPDVKVANMVGRALVALFRRQTEVEQANNVTKEHNKRGFTAPDAKRGSTAAKTFLKHGRFTNEWQWKRWIICNSKGVPRIAKYSRQLNEVAQSKGAS